MAVRGDDPLRIKQRAGHSSFATTEMYIREAENLAAGFGDVFPPLPAGLVGATEHASERSKLRSNLASLHPKIARTTTFPSVEQRGIEHEDAAHVEGSSTDNRDVESGDTPSMGADDALNRAPLDPILDPTGGVETALAGALAAAAVAGRFDVVAQLARELEARRLARMGNVVALPRKTLDRGE